LFQFIFNIRIEKNRTKEINEKYLKTIILYSQYETKIIIIKLQKPAK